MKSLEEIKPGLTLGRYECLLPIARGGMAAVWAARVTGARGFEKIVAVKTMLPTLSDDPNFERMFLDEARIASRIRHPNVAEILDLGEQDSLLYLVMEWIDGAPMSLVMRESFRRGGMPISIGVKIVQDVCAALHAAHELKSEDGASLDLVHRDVSPQNIMLTEGGVVKLVDFGVAKAIGRTAGETDTGLIRGKLAYLAPEQVVAHPLDRRTDLFAAGVILYQITTGKHPFRADNAGATMNNILRRKVPRPSKIVGPTYPPLLDEIVMRAIDREQEFRFQTGADMVKALDEVFVGRARATTEDVAAFVKPIIGPSGEEFRRALRQVSRVPSSSGEDVANLLASGAHPVEGTPASGQWMMSSNSRYDLSPKSTPRLSSSEALDPPPPSPPSPPKIDATIDLSSHSVPLDTPPGKDALAESTMSGAERDAKLPIPPPAKRKKVGFIVMGAVLACALGVLVVARLLIQTPKMSVELTSPITSLPAFSAAPIDTPADAAPESLDAEAVEHDTDAEVEASLDKLDAQVDVQPTISPVAPTRQPGSRTSTPPVKPSTTTKPTSTNQWTPPLSDPGF